MQQKSRVLVFTTAYRPLIGGSEIALEEIIGRLPDIFFDIITPRHKSVFKAFESGGNFNIHRVGPGFESAKIIFPVLGFLKARKLMRDKNYDALHAYQASYGGGAAWLIKLLYPRLPFILTMQEGKKLDEQAFILNWLRELIIKKADVITVISNYLKEYTRNISNNKKVFLIPNGVDLKNFQFPISNFQSNLNLQNPGFENTKTIITVSRLVPKNGLSDLIQAFSILNTKYKMQNTKLMIVGDGPLLASLNFEVKSLRMEDSVNFIGKISNEMIPQYLAQADVFVRPSLSEGLGTAFLEAMAAGLPVIATPVGGISDFLKDGETGLFCRVGDPEDIAAKISKVLSDGVLKSRLILNGRKLVEEKYTWDKISDKFRELYLEAMNNEQ